MAAQIAGIVLKSAGRTLTQKNAQTPLLSALYSTLNSSVNGTTTYQEDKIKRSVFISQSNDIFTNLAIEDWIYKNNDFSNHQVLLVWRNAPCVVIGRHQNPWLEANIDYLTRNGIDIARRNSGGGTVFHDKGNINFTFFSGRDHYNRNANLEIIKRALFRKFSMNIDSTNRYDLLLNNHFKVSGTASREGRTSCYHHCTLLISANKSNLSGALVKDKGEIDTKATRSVPSPIRNIRDANAAVAPEDVLAAVGWEYLRTAPLSLQDGGSDLISKQRGFQLINPTDKWFPGMGKIRDDLRSWSWRFARTPKFTVSRTLYQQEATVTLKVENGIITDIGLKMAASSSAFATNEAVNELRGQRYTSTTFDSLERACSEVEPEAQSLALRA